MDNISEDNTKCAFIAIVGRPNVGKSTLTNYIIGEKISITTDKPQTTRNNIIGLKTEGDTQLVFVDTPGIHTKEVSNLNKKLNKAATSALIDVDAIVFMVEPGVWSKDDALTLRKIQGKKCPVILALNKVDKLKNKEELLKEIEVLQQKHDFKAIIPISATNGTSVDRLLKELKLNAPVSPFYYFPDQTTDKDLNFRLSEIIREKLFNALQQEIPYSTAVVIEKVEYEEKLVRINALIIVARDGQKKIIIGNKGATLKHVGQKSREDIESLLGKKVFLALWVKIKDNWTDSDNLLKKYGLDPE